MSQPKKQGNYFVLPNEIFNMDLSAGEIALYAFLMRMEDRKTYTCYPSFKTIGNALKMSRNTVMIYVRLLEEKGANLNQAYCCGAPRPLFEKRQPDVQNPANKAGGGCLSQTATLQLRQKEKTINAC